MKVAWLVHYPMFSGPHNRLARVAPHLAKHDVDLVAILPDEPGSAGPRLRSEGIEVRQLPLTRLRLTTDPRIHVTTAITARQDVKRLRALFRRLDVDAVVVGGLVNVQGPIAAHLEDIALVWQLVDSRLPRVATALFMPVVSAIADFVMFGGQTLRALHVGSERLRQPNAVVSPGVDVVQFTPSRGARAAVRREVGWTGSDELVVGSVANINPQKGVEYFVRAATLIYRKLPNTRFLIIGARYPTHEEYFQRVTAEVAASGIPDSHFRVIGGRSDLQRWYPAMDLKLITSIPRSEGTTTTAMEAMACEVPVIATDVGAIPEVVQDEVTGRLVPARDPDALAQVALELLGDAARRRELGRAGRRFVESRHSAAAMAEQQYEALLLAREHRAARGRS